MRLILLRHAKSERPSPASATHARLSGRGQNDAPLLGLTCAARAHPDLVRVSDAAHARTEHLASALSASPTVTYEERLYDAGTEALLAAVKETAPEVRTLMVVGHNPGLHDLARLLIASGDVEARERLNEGLPTSGLAVIDFAGDAWRKLHPHGGRLERFVSPRSLAAADRV